MTTIRSDFWSDSWTAIQDQQSFRRIIARMFNLKQNRKDRALISTLLGAAAGDTATSTRKRVTHSTTELGGKRTIETETLVNRATTAGDDTALTADYLVYTSQPSTYPTNKATRP